VPRACAQAAWQVALHQVPAALLGQYDFLDIFSAPDMETAMRVSALMRTLGRSYSEVWPAISRKDFRAIIAAIT
jgi:uncharacterized protein with GYD domain